MARGEGVKQLKDLFAKYRNTLVAPEATVTAAFIEVVADVLEVRITEKNIHYAPQTKTLTVVGSGVLKQEITLHKEELLQHLKGRIGVNSAPKTIL